MFQDIATDNDVVDTDRIEVEQVGLPHLKVVETQAGFDLLATRNRCCRVVNDHHVPMRKSPRTVVGKRPFSATGIQQRDRCLLPIAEPS